MISRLIDKDDAIRAICEACYMYKYVGEHYKDCKYYPCDDVRALEAVPEASSGGGELIARADAIEALCHNCAYYTDAQCKTDSGYWCESGAMIRVDIPSAKAVQGE